MKSYLGLALLAVIGIAGWRIGDSMSSDAMSMAVGVLLGVLAGIPVALLMVASGRRRAEPEDRPRHVFGKLEGNPPQGAAPPVILVTNGAMQAPSSLQGQLPAGHSWPELSAWPHQRQPREFKVVGEREEWLEEW